MAAHITSFSPGQILDGTDQLYFQKGRAKKLQGGYFLCCCVIIVVHGSRIKEDPIHTKRLNQQKQQ